MAGYVQYKGIKSRPKKDSSRPWDIDPWSWSVQDAKTNALEVLRWPARGDRVQRARVKRKLVPAGAYMPRENDPNQDQTPAHETGGVFSARHHVGKRTPIHFP